MNERPLIVAILLASLIVAKPTAVDDPLQMGELIAKAFKLADDLGGREI